MQEKYGFVYIWRDRKHKRYYIGSHWGTESDGYICSSRWMRRSHLNRPDDFKRRTLARVYTNRKDLYLVEQSWLNQVLPHEIRSKYYNLCLSVKNPWYQDPLALHTVGQKISAKKLGKSNGPQSEETKAKISATKKARGQTQAQLDAAKQNVKIAHTTAHSPEAQQKRSDSLKQAYANGTRVAKKKVRRPLYQPGERQKQLWADPEWAANQRQKLKEGSARRHNKYLATERELA